MKMFIPALGTKLRLLKDVEISLMAEKRNERLWDLHHTPPSLQAIPIQHRRFNVKLTPLYAGDEYTIDRIFIRKDQNSFNSVTVKGYTMHYGVRRFVRFWMFLEDFNKLEAEVINA
jgi:hypothetical protein